MVRLLKEADFSEFSYAKGDVSILVRRGDLAGLAPPAPIAPAPKATPAPATVAPPSVAASAHLPAANVHAPLLGTFYSCPKPGEPPFIKLGDRVEPDTVVCIVEVMKLMNSVTAGLAGHVAAIHAQDGDLVEYGQPHFTVSQAP